MSDRWRVQFESNIRRKFLNPRRLSLDVSANLVNEEGTIILESGGVDQAVVFPLLITAELREIIVNGVLDYARKGFLKPDADHTNGEYATDAAIYGCAFLSHSDHAVGHLSDPSTPSGSLVTGCNKFVEGMKLLKITAPLSICANLLIKTVDAECHQRMTELRKKMIRRAPHVEAICSVTPSLHASLGIIVNRRSGQHRDKNDAINVWSVLFVLGNFEGGEMVLSVDEKQEVTTRFRSGDAILLKARDVFHEIRVWGGEIRVTLVYYTHEAVWEEQRKLDEKELKAKLNAD